ncbi:Organic cation transporter protein [Habropoda laboriosa]|uniref:Organic cation transporter protein n=1 Tax=Habropoda laboriosa TaxID=597456 RepID=A0A0L7QR12_9HYME|nr:Organic cation transporter protein [Habropoda laboriosa]
MKKLLGEFGTYQKYLFVVLMVFCMFLTFVYFSQTFITVLPTEYWCKIPQVEGMTNEQLRDFMIPSIKKVPYEGHHLSYSRCWMYDVPVDKAVSAKQPDENWPMKQCSDWYFKLTSSDMTYLSIAAEQRWVCDEAYKATLAQSIFFVGSIFGGLIFGWMADKYGRVPVLIGTNLMGFLGGLCTLYISEFWHFCVCRFVVGLAYDNTFVIAYILVLEYVGPQWRTFTANMSFGTFYTLGAISMPWMAYGIADWKTFTVVTTVPLISVLFAPLIIPESIRWLISMGRIDKAMKILERIEKVNKKVVPPDIYDNFLEDCRKTASTLASETHTIADLFKTRRLRRITILLTLTWGIIQMSYDGHIRCLDSLGMDVFTTFTIASATEFPSELLIIYTLDVLGRRWTLFASVVLSGLFSLAAACFSVGIVFASFAICGRFFINVASNIAMQYAAELLPTVVRGEGVAFIHVLGYVTSIFSPFIAFSSRIMYNMPMIILGMICVFGGILCLFLPETLMEQLPQTLLDGEIFGIDQSFWETPFTKKKPLEPKGHHLHAKRAASRPDMLRSSMISGRKGNVRRYGEVKRRASQVPSPTKPSASTR